MTIQCSFNPLLVLFANRHVLGAVFVVDIRPAVVTWASSTALIKSGTLMPPPYNMRTYITLHRIDNVNTKTTPHMQGCFLSGLYTLATRRGRFPRLYA